LRARCAESIACGPPNAPRNWSRMRWVSAADIGGPSLFQTKDGARSITNAPFTLALLASRLSGVLASMRTTGPRTALPLVPGAHAQLAATTSCTRGATMRTDRGPRAQVPPKFHGSSCPVSPYSWNLRSVQSLAARAAGEPVSRGPITSARYCRFCITWDLVMPWSIRAPTPVVSTGMGGGAWAASGAPTSASASPAAASRMAVMGNPRSVEELVLGTRDTGKVLHLERLRATPLRRRRQLHDDRGALALDGLELHAAAEPGDDVAHHREAGAALALRLGREPRLEHPLHEVLRDAHAAIAHDHPHRFRLTLEPHGDGVRFPRGRVGRVAHEVAHELVNQVAVSLDIDVVEIGGQLDAQAAAAQPHAFERHGGAHRAHDVKALGPGAGAARPVRDRPHEVDRAVHRFLDLRKLGEQIAARGGVEAGEAPDCFGGELQAGARGGEWVVRLVRDHGGHREQIAQRVGRGRRAGLGRPAPVDQAEAQPRQLDGEALRAAALFPARRGGRRLAAQRGDDPGTLVRDAGGDPTAPGGNGVAPAPQRGVEVDLGLVVARMTGTGSAGHEVARFRRLVQRDGPAERDARLPEDLAHPVEKPCGCAQSPSPRVQSLAGQREPVLAIQTGVTRAPK